MKGATLFWVHPGPYSLKFAPDDAAPEAGVRLQVAVNFERAGILDERFADYLGKVRDDAEFTLEALAEEVRSSFSAFALLPCAQPEEIDALRAELSNALQVRLGIECTAMEKADLRDEFDLAQRLLAEARAAPGDASDSPIQKASDSPPAAAVQRPRAVQWLAQLAAAWPKRADVARSDGLLARRLFLDLPRTAWRLRQAKGFCDAQAFSRLGELVERIDRAHHQVSLLPELAPRLAPAKTPKSELRLRAAETRRATDSLSELWSHILRIAPDTTGLTAAQFDALDRLVGNIECAIARRASVPGA